MSSRPDPALATCPPSRRSRRSAFAATLLAVALTAGVAGCDQQRTPDDYNDSVRRDFIEACEGRVADQENEVRASRDVCTCSYDKIRREIDFERFKEVNSDLSDEPGRLPQDFQALVDSCRPAA